jgi:oligo-1,6-glucosidase
MQWDGSSNAGFSDSEPWIAVNPDHDRINAADEFFDPGSVLNYYRYMIGLRKDHKKTMIYGSFRKINSSKDVLAFVREANERFTVVVNLTDKTVRRPDGISGDRIISNYGDASDRLRPYEAEVYFSRV